MKFWKNIYKHFKPSRNSHNDSSNRSYEETNEGSQEDQSSQEDRNSQDQSSQGDLKVTGKIVYTIIYIDVENGCHDLYKYILDYLDLNSLWDRIQVYLYIGNMAPRQLPIYLWDYGSELVVRRNKWHFKELADVLLTLDLYEEANVAANRHIIVAGGDKRYEALANVMRERNVDVQLVPKLWNPQYGFEPSLQSLDRAIFQYD